MIASEEAGLVAQDRGNVPPIAPERPHLSKSLPEEPLIKIRPSSSWKTVDLREVLAHRQLLYFLVWRDLKVRYKQTLLGAAWVILQPLLMTAVFTIFLGRLVRVSSGQIPYPLFLYAGLLPWTFFSNAVSSGSYSLVANAHMITKVYFPRLIIPAAAVTVRLSDFIIASFILIIMMSYYGVRPTWTLLMLPLLVAHLTLLAFSISTWLSALNVRYRDVGTVLPVLLQLWMFVSPVVYPASFVPAKFKWAYELNPLAIIIESFRSSLLGLEFNWTSLITSLIITFILLLFSAYAFRRTEDEFADIV